MRWYVLFLQLIRLATTYPIVITRVRIVVTALKMDCYTSFPGVASHLYKSNDRSFAHTRLSSAWLGVLKRGFSPYSFSICIPSWSQQFKEKILAKKKEKRGGRYISTVKDCVRCAYNLSYVRATIVFSYVKNKNIRSTVARNGFSDPAAINTKFIILIVKYTFYFRILFYRTPCD